jgi:hypothetical protein
MLNLSTTLLAKNVNWDIGESTKQGEGVQFDSGAEQRVVRSSIPSINLSISYRGLTFAEFETLRSMYQNNHSNTFIMDLSDAPSGDNLDLRRDAMGVNASVWVFKSFMFGVSAQDRLFHGNIELVTSVFFNYSEYQDAFAQSSSYTPSPSTDESFMDVVIDAAPQAVQLTYQNNALFSNIGKSVRHARNKGGLKRKWSLQWVLQQDDFMRLITFYRKNGGIMGEFGMPDFGAEAHEWSGYIADDYIADDYITGSVTDGNTNARFAQDSFQFIKRVDGLYSCSADLIEVKQ